MYVRVLHQSVCANKRIIQDLFIDEVHMVDIECFSFLNRAFDNALSPLIILVSNGSYSRDVVSQSSWIICGPS